MATVTFTFTGGIGPNFNVIMTHNGATGSPAGSGNPVNTSSITNVLARDPNNGNAIIGPAGGWTPVFDSGTASVRKKPEVTSVISLPLCEYITWRTENSNVHPTTGYSLDIWYEFNNSRGQTTLSGIDANAYSWAAWAAEGNLPLNSSYWTVLYDYNNQYAIGWKKGGFLTVTNS